MLTKSQGVLWTPTKHIAFTCPPWERRTYGLFRGHVLLGIFVCSVHDDCVGISVYGKGLVVLTLHEFDITAWENRGDVVAAHYEDYQEGGK